MSEIKERLANLSPEQRTILLKKLESAKKVNSLTYDIKSNSSNDVRVPLSFAQQRLWFLEQLEGSSATYNIPFALNLKGQLDKNVLTKCFNEIIKRHDILRTCFPTVDDTPIQHILPHTDIHIDCIKGAFNKIEEILSEHAHIHFNLSTGPLFQLKLIELSTYDHILLITMHHIISDGWSMGVLTNELITLYRAYKDNIKTHLDELQFQYADYSQWQHRYLTDSKIEELLSYWKKHLEGMNALLPLSTDRPRPLKQSYRGAVYNFHFDEWRTIQLQKFSQQENVTLYMTLFSAFYVVLARYTNQFDITIGTTIANRNRREVENLIGFFVNTLVFRTISSGHSTFRSLLNQVKITTLNAYDRQDLPFERLVKALQPDRTTSYSPLFQVMFELNNTPYEDLILPDLDISILNQDMRVAKFDLTLTVQTEKHGLEGSIEYNTDLFDETTIAQFTNHYLNCLQSIVKDPTLEIANIPIISEAERIQILTQYNQTDVKFPLDESVASLFEKQVNKSPDKIAASCNGEYITYNSLNERANQLAQRLVEGGVTLEHSVALFLDRGIPFLIAMLAVLKAGGAFVPLDPKSQSHRVLEALNQCRPTFVITNSKYIQVATELAIHSEKIMNISDVLGIDSSIGQVSVKTYPHSLAYIIFTSGSTGKPKGAMIEQCGLVNHLYGKISDLNIDENDVIGQIAVQTFDVCIWQFLAGLLVGGRTAIFTEDHAWEPKLLLTKIKEEAVTILESVPSHTKVILDEQETNPHKYFINSLRMYITNGEPLTPEQCSRWFQCNPNIILINAYGATECSDDSHHFHLHKTPKISMPYVPVKNPLPNQKTYILDSWLEPTPIGVIGEIYFAGKGVGRGYLNDPARTALSFMPNPFSNVPGDRLYKTGDLARFHVDGSIEFLGRSDFQVKIRGFRIEIGEIESVLTAHPSIESCVVIAQKDDLNIYHLNAYLIPSAHPAPTIHDIKSYCRSVLPDYMIPEAIIILDEFPLSNNGKVDRKRLPAAQESDKDAVLEYIAPRNDHEKRIAKVWSYVLRRENIGIYDNFFKIGGHSLIAAELAIKLQTELGVEIPLRKIFEFPTIATFAENLNLNSFNHQAETQIVDSAVSHVRQFSALEVNELAPCQIPEWYAYQLDKTSPVYNISFCDLFFKNLNIQIFSQAWQVILNRHDVFRIYFQYQDGRPVQKLSSSIILDLDNFYLDYTHLNMDQVDKVACEAAYQYSNTIFDFEKGPLFVLKIAAYPNNQFQLLFVIHHIIWDETSTINLFKELAEVYNAILNEREIQLPNLRLNYFDYVQWMNESIKSGRFEKHKKYWLEVYQSPSPALNLPNDFARPVLQTYRGNTVSTWLSRAQLSTLRSYLQQNNITLFMYMLAVINLYFFRITGQKDIVIGSPIADRDHEDFKPLLGLFATPMPLRCQISENMTFEDLLAHVKNQCLEAYEHHYYPCNLVIEELNHAKDLSRPKLFSVMYGVQNNKTELYNTTKFEEAELFFKNLYGAESHSARFDLTLVVDQWGSDIAFNCIYNLDIFKESTIKRMMQHMGHILDEVLQHPKSLLTQLLIMSPACLHVLHKYNGQNKISYPHITIPELIQNQVSKTPNAIAIKYNTTTITYENLASTANCLANYLIKEKGIKRGNAIGVFLNPSINMIISLLAILKVGAHYVPILPSYPENRIKYILAHAEIQVVITDNELINVIEYTHSITMNLDECMHELDEYASESSIIDGDADDIAYVIYTSGTTGQPKGIPIKHIGVINLIQSTQNQHKLTVEDKIFFLTPFTFDASILDIFWPLSTGSQMIISNVATTKDPSQIANLLIKNEITVIQCVPIMLEALIETNVKPKNLRLVISGGALLTRTLRNIFFERWSCQLFNHYGPTEVSVDATRFDCSLAFDGDIVPIGKPLANISIFILDKYHNLVPIGVVGEIYIATPGLTPGYLKEPEKTEQVFINKIINQVAYRLYKSGDLAKWSEDGNIYYIGRIDKQVKVRGNRVELEEIDNALIQHPSIKRSLTKYIPKNVTDGQLVTFIEINSSVNSFYVNNNRYQMFTLHARPELLRQINAAHTDAWPKYFSGSKILREYWPRLYNEYPEYQVALVTNNDKLAAVGNTIPIYWNGEVNQLPQGWDHALCSAFNDKKTVPNTLLVLAGIVTREFQGKNLSIEILKAFKVLKQSFKFQHLLVAVRPTGKTLHPDVTFTEWCTLRRDDGQLTDNWLRMHERIGGKILKIALQSQYIEGSVSEWQTWTGQKITDSGCINLPDTLQPADIDFHQQTVKYYDPAVWVEHFNNDERYSWQPTDKHVLRHFLATQLPSYMIPEQFYFLPKFPLLDTGKIDERTVQIPSAAKQSSFTAPKSEMQSCLVNIWQDILKIAEIGIYDDFFELGGQSLKVIQMLTIVESEFGIKVPLCHFYLAATVKDLEDYINNKRPGFNNH